MVFRPLFKFFGSFFTRLPVALCAAVLTVFVSVTPSGADVAIDCPAVGDRVDPVWTEAPTKGRYVKSYVARNRSLKVLVCRYVHDQQGYAVMRPAPRDNRNCHPTESGFLCRPKFLSSKVLTRGAVALNQSHQVDLLQGEIGPSPENDLWFDFVLHTRSFLRPVNGARMGVYEGTRYVSKNECARTTLTTEPIPTEALRNGAELCLRLGDDRYATVKVDQTKGFDPGTLHLAYIVWQ